MLGEEHPAPVKSALSHDPTKALRAGTGTNGDMLRFWGKTLFSQGNSRAGEHPTWESRMWKERV